MIIGSSLPFAKSRTRPRSCHLQGLVLGLVVSTSMGATSSVTAGEQFSLHSSIESHMTPWSRQLRCSTFKEAITTFEEFGAALVDTEADEQHLELLSLWMLKNLPLARSAGQPGRWSLTNGTNHLQPEFQVITQNSTIWSWVDCLVDASLVDWQGPHRNSKLHRTGGDIVAPKTLEYQALHSDDSKYKLSSMVRGYSLVLSVAPTMINASFAPLRLVPWSAQHEPYPDGLMDESLQTPWLVTMKPREMLIRDSRVAHGGSPNATEKWRALPGMQILTPQYQEDYAHGGA